MKLRTEKQQVWIEKTNGEETARFLVDLLTPKENSKLVTQVTNQSTGRKSKDIFDSETMYKLKVARIDKTIIDWEGVEDQDGNSIKCTAVNKEAVYNYNRDLIDEVLDEADRLADIRNVAKGEETKNS